VGLATVAQEKLNCPVENYRYLSIDLYELQQISEHIVEIAVGFVFRKMHESRRA